MQNIKRKKNNLEVAMTHVFCVNDKDVFMVQCAEERTEKNVKEKNDRKTDKPLAENSFYEASRNHWLICIMDAYFL